MSAFDVSPKGYLSRARAALHRSETADLFYAAFELRCCVESRQTQYVEALERFKDVKIKPWRLAENNSKILKNSFNEKISRVTYYFDELSNLVTFHTPVTNSLIKYVEQFLNPLLHTRRPADNAKYDWEGDLKAQLLAGYQACWLACQGNSLTPPLWNVVDKGLHPTVLEFEGHPTRVNQLIESTFKTGKSITVQVEYLDGPPPEWVSDLTC